MNVLVAGITTINKDNLIEAVDKLLLPPKTTSTPLELNLTS